MRRVEGHIGSRTPLHSTAAPSYNVLCSGTLAVPGFESGIPRVRLDWPSIHWALAEAFASGDTAERATIRALFAGFNSYLGNFIGEFLGELSLNLFFLISAGAMLPRRSGFPRALGLFGILAACTGLVGMFRNAVDAVDPVAELNNYLLPLWMMAFGIGLLRNARPVPPVPGDTRGAAHVEVP